MEDEIDLRKYVAVLAKHWKLIVIITGIAVIVAGVVSFLLPPVYEAEASVLMTKARSDIVLEPNYRTALQQDSTSMRQALLALVKSPSVANQVIEQLGNELTPGERTDKCLDMIRVNNQGDLIQISVECANPHKAADIANAWAKSYKAYINSLYSGILQTPEGLQGQADFAEKQYEEKQKALEDFIKDNRIAELSQQINDKEILYDAKLLREHIMSDSASAAPSTANSLALVLLQTRAFTSLSSGTQMGTSNGTQINMSNGLQISLGPLSGSEANLGTVDSLISTLEERSGGKRGESLIEVQKDTLLLKAELEQENAKQRELKGARDIAWDAYTTVAGKSVETQVAAQAQAGIVEVAEFAAVPESPAGRHRVMNIGIALVLGLIVGVFAAFGVEYFRKST